MKKKKCLDEKFWIEKQGNLTKIGLTQSALHSFDQIDWIELPQVGTVLQKGAPAFIVESAKAAIDIESPVSGIVKEVNKTVEASPKLLDQAPEETWLLVVEECH